MKEKVLRLRIPSGFMVAEIDKAIQEDKVIQNKLRYKLLPANVVCNYNVNGNKTLLPINPEDDIKVVHYFNHGDHIDVTFHINGKSELLYLEDAKAVLRGSFDLRQERLEILGFDILVCSDKPKYEYTAKEILKKTKDYNKNVMKAVTLDIKLPEFITAKQLYDHLRKDERVKELINQDSFYGEPETVKFAEDFYVIKLPNVSHRILALYIEEDHQDQLKADVLLFADDLGPVEDLVLVPRMTIKNSEDIDIFVTFDITTK